MKSVINIPQINVCIWILAGITHIPLSLKIIACYFQNIKTTLFCINTEVSVNKEVVIKDNKAVFHRIGTVVIIPIWKPK